MVLRNPKRIAIACIHMRPYCDDFVHCFPSLIAQPLAADRCMNSAVLPQQPDEVQLPDIFVSNTPSVVAGLLATHRLASALRPCQATKKPNLIYFRGGAFGPGWDIPLGFGS